MFFHSFGIAVSQGTWWSVHFVSGIPFMAGIFGLLVWQLIFLKKLKE
jgi:hypothetical protein